MPKIKTNKSLAKRIIIKKKKVLRRAPNRAHFRSVKKGSDKRDNRQKQAMSKSILKKAKMNLPK